jgi:predicted alpha/beta-fold hydrolase
VNSGHRPSPTPPIAGDYRPPALLRNAHVQSVLASSAVRRLIDGRRHHEVLARSTELILDGGDGVRLQGFHARPDRGQPTRGLAVVFHGWEGSANSAYVLNLSRRLLAEGWEVARINFRDHGGTHHLNAEIFHSCRIDEVVGAVADLARRYPARPMIAAGFSLGGNFALRVALRAPAAGIPLAGVAAVCPAVHPPNILTAIEGGSPIYDIYFMMQWRESLRRKQRLFPDRYSFPPEVYKLSMRELTRFLIENFTEFDGLDAYLHGYSIAGDRLAALEVPAAILTSRDDPIIPVSDFEELVLPPTVRLDVARHGGHCGFITGWSLRSWAEDWLAARVAEFGGAVGD